MGLTTSVKVFPQKPLHIISEPTVWPTLPLYHLLAALYIYLWNWYDGLTEIDGITYIWGCFKIFSHFLYALLLDKNIYMT